MQILNMNKYNFSTANGIGGRKNGLGHQDFIFDDCIPNGTPVNDQLFSCSSEFSLCPRQWLFELIMCLIGHMPCRIDLNVITGIICVTVEAPFSECVWTYILHLLCMWRMSHMKLFIVQILNCSQCWYLIYWVHSCWALPGLICFCHVLCEPNCPYYLFSVWVWSESL